MSEAKRLHFTYSADTRATAKRLGITKAELGDMVAKSTKIRYNEFGNRRYHQYVFELREDGYVVRMIAVDPKVVFAIKHISKRPRDVSTAVSPGERDIRTGTPEPTVVIKRKKTVDAPALLTKPNLVGYDRCKSCAGTGCDQCNMTGIAKYDL